MKLKFIFSLILVIIICISSCLFVSASTFTPYSGLSDTSSQASLLYGYYRNLDTFSFDDEFIIMRSDQYSYYLFYADDLSSSSVNYISYIGQSSNYNTVYEVSFGIENNFSYVLNNYSVVGNIPGTVQFSSHIASFDVFNLQLLLCLFIMFFLFYLFRSHFKELSSD